MITRLARTACAGLLLTAWLLTACQSPPGGQQEPSPNTPDAAAIELVDELLSESFESLWQESSCPGVSIGWATDDGLDSSVGVGLSDPETNRSLRPGDRMLSGSIGKTYVSAVALQLVGEGTLELDAPVSRWLGTEPWFERLPNASVITVRDLMRHTTGIPRHIFQPGFIDTVRDEPDRVWQPEELLAYVFDAEPVASAGEAMAYADTNYVLLGMVIEHITKNALYREIWRRVLLPLGLSDTLPSDRRTLPGLIPGFMSENDPFGMGARSLENGVYVINPQFEWAGGGYYSTTRDLALWGVQLFTKKAFPEHLWTDFIDGVDFGSQGDRYGLGVMLRSTERGPTLGHGGTMIGYLSQLEYFVDHGLAVAVQLNCDVAMLREDQNPRDLVARAVDVVLGTLDQSGDRAGS